MIRTRSGIGPPLAGPGLVAQLPAAQDRTIVVFELQQQDRSWRTVPACDELAARRVNGTPDRAHALSRLGVRDGGDLRQRGLPDAPAAAVQEIGRAACRERG